MKRKLLRKRSMVLLAAVMLLVGWIAWGNSALMVNEIAFESSDLPEAFSGFRIAQISDLHNAAFGEDNARLLDMLADTEPDIIAITGDLVDSRRTDIGVALSFAEKAAEIAPVYYVSGNHESRLEEYAGLKSGLEEAGVTVLEDEWLHLEKDGERIRLIGLMDPDFEGAEDAEGRLSQLADGEEFSLLLSHRPELFDIYADKSIDLALSGHAHGGQMRLPFLGGVIAPDQGLFPQYDAGLYTRGGTGMVVSRGLGNSLFPFRVNNRPEIVLVELKQKT